MKKILLIGICCLIVLSSLKAEDDPLITIKIGIYYTSNASSVITSINAQAHIDVVQTVLDDISENTYEAVLTSLTQIDYQEPKHRSEDYAINSYDGMRQVFGELVDHVNAYNYFKDLGETDSFGMLESGEVDAKYALLDLIVRSDINIFIVDEDGLEDYYFVDNPLDPLDDHMGDYAGTAYEGILPAVIHATEYKANTQSIALAVFGLLADPDDAAVIDEESTTGSLLNFFSYYYNGFSLSGLGLSTENKCTFKNSLKKMKLDSRDVIDINLNIKGSNKRLKIDANRSVRMVSSSTSSKVIAPTGADDFVAMSADAYTTDSDKNPTCSNNTNARTAIAENDEINEVYEDSDKIAEKATPLTLYPNPFTNTFKVVYDRAETASDQVVATVYDLSGRVALVQQFSVGNVAKTELEIDGSNLAIGHYIIELNDGSGTLKRGKLIKER